MQKKLIAAAIGALCAVPAFAQSNVTIYGRVDMGYRTFTNDGKATLEDQESSNRWGIMGEEDLGGGLKAFFQLENRFFLDNGNQDTNRQWKDKAWVGLKHNNLGAVSFGRIPGAAYSLYGGTYEAFGGDTIGSMPSRRGKTQNNWDNAAKYESPMFGGIFKVVGTLGLGENNAVNNKTRWGVGGQLAVAGLKMDAVYQKDTVGDESIAGSKGFAGMKTATVDGLTANPWKTWFVTANYNFQVVEIFGGYAQSKGYNGKGNLPLTYTGLTPLKNKGAKFTVYQIGFRVPLGASTIMGNAGRIKERAADSVGGRELKAQNHFALGYWYNLSKRTILMANLSYDRSKDGVRFGEAKSETGKDSVFGTELAIRHTF